MTHNWRARDPDLFSLRSSPCKGW